MFSDKDLQKVAGECGFYKKKSDFMPTMFFDMLLYCASQTEACSLEQASCMVSDKFRLKISKQAIDERFNNHSVVFVKEILKKALEKQLSKVFAPLFLPEFNRIRIKDATRFNVSDRLSNNYPGSGGSKGASNATVCIQFEYDAKSGKILSLDITGGRRNDQTDAKETVTRVDLGDLIIRDLGYYSLPTLTSFDKSGAFFISRFGSKTNAYEIQTEEEISFKKLYSTMIKGHISRMEKTIYAGKAERAP
ncbi:MAG: IS4 family transposase [Bacteroidales bacterium]